MAFAGGNSTRHGVAINGLWCLQWALFLTLQLLVTFMASAVGHGAFMAHGDLLV